MFNMQAAQVVGHLLEAARVSHIDEVHAYFTLLEESMPQEEMTGLLTELTMGTHLVYNVPVPGMPKASEVFHFAPVIKIRN